MLGVNADFFAVLGCRFIFNIAIDKCEKCMVSANADIVTRLNSSSSLSDKYGASINLLTAISFYTQSF